MHVSASLATDCFGDILARLLADLDLDALALRTKAIESKRKIGDGKTLLRVALARGPGGFAHLALTDNHVAESVEHGAPLPGEVRICDRNYARAGKLRRFRAASDNQADFIVRMSWRAFRLSRPDFRSCRHRCPSRGIRPKRCRRSTGCAGRSSWRSSG